MFRMAARRQARCRCPTSAPTFRASRSATTGNRVIVWADRPDCPDLACAATSFPAKSDGQRAASMTRCSSATGTPGPSPARKSRIYAFPVVGGKLGGEARVTGTLVGDTPSKPFGGGEEIAVSPDGRTVYFALREAGRIEPTSTNLDIFAAPADGRRAPVNLTDANDGTDTLPTLSPDGRTLAYVVDGARRLRGRPPGDHAARPRQRPDARADRRAGTARPARSPGRPTAAACSITAEDVMEAPVLRVDVASGAGHPADRRRPCRQCRAAARRRRDLHPEQHHGARRSVPRRRRAGRSRG